MKLHESQRGSLAILIVVFLCGALFGAFCYYLILELGVPQ
jgi:hypothetical protein